MTAPIPTCNNQVKKLIGLISISCTIIVAVLALINTTTSTNRYQHDFAPFTIPSNATTMTTTTTTITVSTPQSQQQRRRIITTPPHDINSEKKNNKMKNKKNNNNNESTRKPFRKVASKQHQRQQHHRTLQSFPYGNLRCPLEISSYSNFNRARGFKSTTTNNTTTSSSNNRNNNPYLRRALQSARYALSLDAPSRIQRAVTHGAFRNRRLIFLGDSLTRELVTSLGCLITSSSSSLSLDESSMAIPWESYRSRSNSHANDKLNGKHSIFYSARVRLSPSTSSSSRRGNDTELLYYHLPHLLGNHDNTKHSPLPLLYTGPGKYSWLQSCRRGLPFLLHLSNQLRFEEEPHHKQSLWLTSRDIVIMNGSVWKNHRDIIMRRFTAVLNCMTEMRKTGEEFDWPTMVYMRTPAVHHPSGMGDGECSRGEPTMESIVYQMEDDVTFGSSANAAAAAGDNDGLVSYVLGKDIPWNNLGAYHVGDGDCTHYTQMGPHDGVAAELADYVRMRGGDD